MMGNGELQVVNRALGKPRSAAAASEAEGAPDFEAEARAWQAGDRGGARLVSRLGNLNVPKVGGAVAGPVAGGAGAGRVATGEVGSHFHRDHRGPVPSRSGVPAVHGSPRVQGGTQVLR